MIHKHGWYTNTVRTVEGILYSIKYKNEIILKTDHITNNWACISTKIKMPKKQKERKQKQQSFAIVQ